MKNSERVKKFVTEVPGNTSTYIATALRLKPSTVSSCLSRLITRGELRREGEMHHLNGQNVWRYYGK